MKKFLKISAISAIILGGITSVNAQTIVANDFFNQTNALKWEGTCVGRAGGGTDPKTGQPWPCRFHRGMTNYTDTMFSRIQDFDTKGQLYTNWVINGWTYQNIGNTDITRNGLIIYPELPGKHTATFPVTINNFQKEDFYNIEFDLTPLMDIEDKETKRDAPYLQVKFGDFEAHERDTTSDLAKQIKTIPNYAETQPQKTDAQFWEDRLKYITDQAERDRLIKLFLDNYIPENLNLKNPVCTDKPLESNKGYRIDETIEVRPNTVKVKITARGKDICTTCNNGDNITQNLSFTNIFMNNWDDIDRFRGRDYVIYNLQITTNPDTEAPADLPNKEENGEKVITSEWTKENKIVKNVKTNDTVQIRIIDVERDAKVEVEGATCEIAPDTENNKAACRHTDEYICTATIGKEGFDGSPKKITITDPTGLKNENLKTPKLIVDNNPPVIDFTNMNFTNDVDKNPTKVTGADANEVTIQLGNGVNFDNFLAKITDDIDKERVFTELKDIHFKGNILDANGEIIAKDEKITDQNTKLLATGNFELTFTAEDSAGNKVTKILKVTVTPNNTTTLEEEIKKETVVNEDKYKLDNNTDKKNYDDALQKAKDLISKQKELTDKQADLGNNPTALQKDIDTALKNLQDAYVKLDGKKTETSTNNSGNGGGGPGGYVPNLTPVKETTPTKPITTADNQNIFKTGNIGGQCVSIVKNLDEPRLVDYYTSTLNINSDREVHTDVSRGEFMKMLFLASGVDISNITIRTDIADVDVSNPYARYISAGLHYGLVHGQTDGTNLYFRPSDSLSRAEAAKIFIRAANLGTSAFSGIFSDVAESLTLSEYIESAYNNCLLHGRKTLNGQPMNGKPRVFEPYSPITIAETAKVLYNMTH